MKLLGKFGIGGAAVVAALVATAAPAGAATFGFVCATGAPCTAPLAAQLSVDVTSTVAGFVDFAFKNNVGIASNVSEIYFDSTNGGTAYLTGPPNIITETGVDFSNGGTPADLPGGNSFSPNFSATSGLLVSANNPAPGNGINSASDLLVVRYGIGAGQTFNSIIAALLMGPTVDALRIGFHVTGIAPSGNSTAVVCCTPRGGPSGDDPGTVPEPASIALFGLAALASARRVRRG